MANQVYVCGTLFHIYISILKSVLEHKRGTKSLLIVNDHTPNLEQILERIKENNYFDEVIVIPFFLITKKLKKQESFIKRTFLRNRLSVKYVENYSSINKFIPFIKHSEINLFYNLGLVSSYFIINFPNNHMRMLEDGYRNYNPKINNFTAFKRKHILRSAIGEGRDNCIKTIEVQHPHELPKQVRHKGVKLELEEMQKMLTDTEKSSIISVFLGDVKINIGNEKSLILLTQPLSEDNLISEAIKISLYQSILKEYSGEYTIYLKSHPRDLTNYDIAFDFEFIDIPKSFPMELLNFYDNIKFDLGITLFSSAIDNLTCIEKKITLGIDYMKKFKA